MRVVVTGAAGFIGSTLAERLAGEGWDVLGIDSFTPYYDSATKRSNLSALGRAPRFTFREADLLTANLAELLDGVDVVFHLAGQPGVRLSWADGFRVYTEMNVNVTQRLLEAARDKPLQRLVYASSSSVYGNPSVVPTTEDQPTRPHSPYGITKLAGEMLCDAYCANFGVPTASVRYFTVYGPRQRPDMATYRLIEAALDREPFPLFGDGQQVRDFTYVDDIVNATVLAGTSDLPPGTVVNAAGGSSIKLLDLIDVVGEAVGKPVLIDWRGAEPGDVERTAGSTELARRLLGWVPQVDLASGVGRQLRWHRERRHAAG